MRLAFLGFRPLIRGFFFYSLSHTVLIVALRVTFPSPHSGILFLCGQFKAIIKDGDLFPSPHSGILFLLIVYRRMSEKELAFPSPHSGILFL